jgi:hypothetical protein
MPARGNSCFVGCFLIFSSEMSRQNEPKLGRKHVYKVLYKGSKVTVTLYISLKQSILLFSLFTDGGNLYLQLNLVQFWKFLGLYPLPTALCNVIYSYKYLESDLIRHCHVIFIHSLGQPLIVRSHSKVHCSRGNPKKIPTGASNVSNYSNFPWFNRQ